MSQIRKSKISLDWIKFPLMNYFFFRFPLEEIQEKIGELNSKDFSPICKRHTYFQLKKSDPYEKGIGTTD